MKPNASSSRTPTVGFAACALDVQASLAGRAQIFPMGEFRSDDGSGRPTDCRAWKMTPEIGQRLVAAATARTTPYCFDYEHQVLRAQDNGKPAPAAGWFQTLEVRDDGIWATDIEWTPAARQMIEAGEYRYTSPLFAYSTKTGEVSNIVNVALTNTPALDGMAALAAASAIAALSIHPSEENPMDELLERLRYLLNLPVTATADDISTHLDKIKSMIAGDTATAAAGVSLVDHLASLRQNLADTQTALAAASSKTPTGGAPDPAKFVPMDQFVTMQNQVAALTRQLEDGERNDLMEAALSDGRILAPQKDYWSKQPIAALKSYLEVAQPLAALGSMQTGGVAPSGASTAALSADQSAICKRLGLDQAKFAQSLGKGV